MIEYFKQGQNVYLTIENGIIEQMWLFGKKIELGKIKQIEKFAGEYILKTDKTELTINMKLIDTNSLTELNAVLDNLKIESN